MLKILSTKSRVILSCMTVVMSGMMAEKASAGNPFFELTGTNNAYTGNTIIQNATLRVSNANVLSSAIGTSIQMTNASSVLQAGDDVSLTQPISVQASGATIDANGNVVTINGAVTSGNIIDNLNISSSASNGTVYLTNASIYTAPITVQNNATLQGNVSMAPLTLNNGGTYDLNSGDQTVTDLSGSGAVIDSSITGGAAAAHDLSVRVNNGSSFSGSIAASVQNVIVTQ